MKAVIYISIFLNGLWIGAGLAIFVKHYMQMRVKKKFMQEYAVNGSLVQAILEASNSAIRHENKPPSWKIDEGFN